MVLVIAEALRGRSRRLIKAAPNKALNEHPPDHSATRTHTSLPKRQQHFPRPPFFHSNISRPHLHTVPHPHCLTLRHISRGCAHGCSTTLAISTLSEKAATSTPPSTAHGCSGVTMSMLKIAVVQRTGNAT